VHGRSHSPHRLVPRSGSRAASRDPDFASYLLIFTTLLNISRDFQFQQLVQYLNVADSYAYIVLVAGWAYAAWVPAHQPVLSLNVMRRLQLETV
jgi:hypothetical protein